MFPSHPLLPYIGEGKLINTINIVNSIISLFIFIVDFILISLFSTLYGLGRVAMNHEWQPVFDDASQRYYYWNIRTQETTWVIPASFTPQHHTTAIKTKDDEASGQHPEKNTSQAASSSYQAKEESTESEASDHELSLSPQKPPAEFQPTNYPSQAPYYNTMPHRTLPERPTNITIAAQQFSAILDKIDAHREGTSNPPPIVASVASPIVTDNSSEYKQTESYVNYTIVGGFNVLTGKFRSNASKGYAEFDRAQRQIDVFFNHDAYVGEINAAGGRKNYVGQRKLTKKALDELKLQKKEKKEKSRRRWLENI
jgi:hypothetical protein